MNNLEALMACLLSPDFDDIVACFGADTTRGTSTAGKAVNGKTRRSPQERAFKAARKAVREGNLAALTGLVKSPKQANWYASDRAWCLLDEAVKADSPAMVQWLLEHGANPNMLFLHDKPFDLSKGPVKGTYFSPFASAITHGNKQIVELMLAHGADINLPVIYEHEDDWVACRYLAEQHGMWPCIEAFLIGQVASVTNTASDAKRL